MQGNNTEKLVATLATPFQSLEAALQQLLTERSIDTAVGAQLDVIGRIVGQPRNGLDDDTYRRYCRARIATNKSNGTIENLITVTDLVVYDDDATYKLTQEGNATARLRIADIAITTELAEIVFAFVQDAAAAGVRIVVQWTESAIEDTFTLDAGPGLDVGHLAGSFG